MVTVKNKTGKLNHIQKILLESFEKKLFVGVATKQSKKKPYKAINPLGILHIFSGIYGYLIYLTMRHNTKSLKIFAFLLNTFLHPHHNNFAPFYFYVVAPH